MCTVLSVFNVDHWYIGLMHSWFLDRGKRAKEARSRKRVEDLIQHHEAERSNAAAAEIEELDQEAGRLAQKLMEHVTEKRKRDFEVRLLKEISRKGKLILGACLRVPLQRHSRRKGKGTKEEERCRVALEMQERLRELSDAIVPQGCASKYCKGSGFLSAQASTSPHATGILVKQ